MDEEQIDEKIEWEDKTGNNAFGTESRGQRVTEHPLYQTGFFVLFSFLEFVILELFFDVSFLDYSLELIAKNTALIVAVNLILLGISHSARTALCVSEAFFLLLGIANYFVILFRGYGIVFMDLYAVKTAMNVAGNYHYEISFTFVAAVIGGFGLIAGARIFLPRRKHPYCHAKYMLLSLSAVACSLLFLLWINMDVVFFRGVSSLSWDHKIGMRENGYLLYFAANAGKVEVSEPAGYSLERVKEILEPYCSQEEPAGKGQKKPNLIMIMNESFSDLNVLGTVRTNEPVMPFYQSLEGNVVKGYAHSSVYGGYTANSEFEFLTGATKAYLPGNPYLQYLDGKIPNLVTNLKEQGYEDIVAMHPYHPSGYNRNRVYPLLGFDRCLFLDDFPQKKMVRGYVGDEENYEKIEELYEKRKQGTPFCVFNVTMQNHNPYDDKDYKPDHAIEVTNFPVTTSTEQYLSLMRESDSALEQLIHYFENVEEPTLILLFGDHQPHLSDDFYYRLMGKRPDFFTPQEVMDKHLVPYMLWANYDISSVETEEKMSLNYLSKMMLEAAGLRTTAYDRFLMDVQSKLPSVSASGYYDKKGELHQYEEEQEESSGKTLEEYEIVQYHYLFSGKDRLDKYFTLGAAHG